MKTGTWNTLLSAGFRPFFAGAAGVAVIWMGLWTGFVLTGTPVYETIRPVLWHGHEMLFGFAMAVIAGFLLTAMQNWTGLKPVTPGQLALLVFLWLAGRLAFAFSGTVPLWLLSLLDLLFLPALLVFVARTLIKAGNRRNYVFIGMLPVFWILNLLLHLEIHQYVFGIAYKTLDTTIFLIVTLLVFMGGRVIPFFTANRLPQAAPRQWPWLNWAATLMTLALIPVYLLTGREDALIPWLIVAAILNAARLFAWKPWHTWHEPMLWILHLGYAWIPVGLLVLAVQLYGNAFPWSAGVHALMAGAMSTLIIGMITRVTLGHTGRPLVAPVPAVLAFYCITLAAIVRVITDLFSSPYWVTGAAGILWCLAFLFYALVFIPILLKPRIEAS